jgi:uncharacterized protein YgfB (UPF0149 family)
MALTVKLNSDLAKLADSPITVPLENADKRFANIFNAFAAHKAKFSLGFGALANKISVDTADVKDVQKLVDDLSKLDGVVAVEKHKKHTRRR